MTTRRKDTGKPGNGGMFDPVRRGESSKITLDSSVPLIDVTPATQRVLDALTDIGGHPLMVGGCVRDALLGDKHPKDVDIEVYGIETSDVVASLRKVGRVDEVGSSFVMTKVLVDGEDFDVALPRTEVKTGEGHRDFEVIADPHASTEVASARRDFTINAMMYDPATGEVIDHWGGRRDLRDGILRHVSDKFDEDPLRVMRAARFAGRFNMQVHPDTAAYCRAISDKYGTISADRVWKEWRRMAGEGTSMTASLKALVDTGWIEHFPELNVLRDVPQDPRWHPEGTVWDHTGQAADKAIEYCKAAGIEGEEREIVVLATLCHDFGKAEYTQIETDENGETRIHSRGHAEGGVKPVREFLHGMDAPHHVIGKVEKLVEHHMDSVDMPVKPRPAVVRKLMRNLAPATLDQWLLVRRADRAGRGTASVDPDVSGWKAVELDEGPKMKPLLTGDHLIAAGMKPGPAFRPILEDALNAQDEGVFDDEAGALAWLTDRIG